MIDINTKATCKNSFAVRDKAKITTTLPIADYDKEATFVKIARG